MNNSLSSESKLFIYLIEDDKKFLWGINFDKFDWIRFLKLASFNRILHFAIGKLLSDLSIPVPGKIEAMMRDILKVAENYLEKLKKTLELCKNVLEKEGIEYLIVKTDKVLRFATMDVDLFVHKYDIERVRNLFAEKAGAKVTPFLPKNQTDIYVEGLLMIDLHEDFFWFRQEYFDNELVWNEKRQIAMEGVEVPIPSKTIDMLLTVAHILYERLHVTLLEFNYILVNSCDVDWEFIYREAEKYHWEDNLNYFANMMNVLCAKVYGKNHDVIPIRKKVYVSISRNLEFPYLLPFSQMMMIFARNLVQRRHLKYYDVAYHVFANLRCQITRGEKYPMFYHWYKFGEDK